MPDGIEHQESMNAEVEEQRTNVPRCAGECYSISWTLSSDRFGELNSKFSDDLTSYLIMGTREITKDQNDSALIQRYVQGDREAFGELYKKYNHRLAGYCYRLLHDPTTTQDVVQTVFAKALKAIHSLEKPELFYYWLFTIARNEVYGTLRTKRSNGAVELTDDVWDSETPHETMVRKETVLFVDECLDLLKAEYREVLILRHFEQLSYSEIAAITDSTIGSVESRLFRARKALTIRLKTYLKQGDENEL